MNFDEFQWIIWIFVFWKWVLVDLQDAPELLPAVEVDSWDSPEPVCHCPGTIQSVHIQNWDYHAFLRILCLLFPPSIFFEFRLWLNFPVAIETYAIIHLIAYGKFTNIQDYLKMFKNKWILIVVCHMYKGSIWLPVQTMRIIKIHIFKKMDFYEQFIDAGRRKF